MIAYPTEAVWGIGCDPFDRAAVLRLLDSIRAGFHDVPLVEAPDPDDSPEAAVADPPPAGDVADPEDRLSVL